MRFDECDRGLVDHALRFTIQRSRKAYIYPATHAAGHTDDATVARMGERLRLKAAVAIDELPPKHARAVALALSDLRHVRRRQRRRLAHLGRPR